MITNAQTSNVHMDKKQLKALMRRSDRPGLTYLAAWIALLAITGTPVMLTARHLVVHPGDPGLLGLFRGLGLCAQP